MASRGDIFDSAYKERHSLKTLRNSTSSTNEELPEEFVHEMDHECQLDEGALRRIWREARQIVPDATPPEIRHFFRERALVVGRNRRVQNPVGLLLSSIPDWFSSRRVLGRRQADLQAAHALVVIQEELMALQAASNEGFNPAHSAAIPQKGGTIQRPGDLAGSL